MKKNDKSGFIRIDSPNSDNESIYFKFNNISNQKMLQTIKEKHRNHMIKKLKKILLFISLKR